MKRFCAFLLALLFAAVPALADPLPLLEDRTESVSRLYDEEDPSAGQFVFSVRYPRADPDAPGGDQVNDFYETRLRELQDFYIDHDFDYYQEMSEDCVIDISYEITCNNDAYFSVLVRKTVTAEEETVETWSGDTFDRLNGPIGLTASLPVLMGLLHAGDSDQWLDERQTQKVSDAVVSLIMEEIRANPSGIAYREDLTEDLLALALNAEEDFYLDETGNPVFFIFPGYIADEEEGFLTFPVAFRDIEDEI